MEKIIENIIIVIGAMGLIAGIGLLLAFPIKWCWNYTMPDLFNLPIISWGQAWCLHFLAGMLIKSSLNNSE